MFSLFLSISLCKNYCLMEQTEKDSHCTLENPVLVQTFDEIKTSAAEDEEIIVQVYGSAQNTVNISFSSIETKSITFYGDDNSLLNFDLSNTAQLTNLVINGALATFINGTESIVIINSQTLTILNSSITVGDGKTISVSASKFIFDTKAIQNIDEINVSTEIIVKQGVVSQYTRQKSIYLTDEDSNFTAYLSEKDSTLIFDNNIVFNLQTAVLPFKFAGSNLNFITNIYSTAFSLNIVNITDEIKSINFDITNDTIISVDCKLDTAPITITNTAPLTINSLTSNSPFEFNVKGTLIGKTTVNNFNIRKLNLIEDGCKITFESNQTVNIKELQVTNSSIFVSNKYTPISVESAVFDSVYYTNYFNEFIPLEISKSLTVIDSTLQFYILNLKANIAFDYRIGLKGTGISAIQSKSGKVLINASYYKDIMPTDEEVDPILNKTCYFFKTKGTLCSDITVNIPETGVVGFTKSTSVLEIGCASSGDSSTFTYRIADYPSRVYPVFCYENCTGFQWALTQGEFGSYITKYTKKAVLQINSDMDDQKTFNFDGAVKNNLYIDSNTTDSSYPKLYLKISDSTKDYLNAIYVDKVKIKFVGSPLSISRAYFNNVVFLAESQSVGKVGYLQVSKKAYETLPSADLIDYFLDVHSETYITFAPTHYEFGDSYVLQKRGDTLPILAFNNNDSVTVRISSSSFENPLRFGFLENQTGQSIKFKIEGDWPKACLLNYVGCSVAMSFTTGILPISFGSGCYLTATASKEFVIAPFTVDNFAVTIISTEKSTISQVTVNGQGKLTSKLTTIDKVIVNENSFGLIDVSKVNSDVDIPGSALLDLGETDISGISIKLYVLITEMYSKLMYSGNQIPKELFVDFSVSEAAAGNISASFFSDTVMLVQSQKSNLSRWGNIINQNVKNITTPNTPISIDIQAGESIIYAEIKGYKPHISYQILNGTEIVWISLGVAAFVAIIALVIYCCIKWNKKRPYHQYDEEGGILDDIEAMDDLSRI